MILAFLAKKNTHVQRTILIKKLQHNHTNCHRILTLRLDLVILYLVHNFILNLVA